MTILVTGAAGFIGKHLVRSLLDDGHVVVGVDNFITADRADIEPLLAHERFTFVERDIVDGPLDDLPQADSLSAIFNLACPTGVPNLVPLAYEMLATCYDGSRNVLELARKSGATVLLTSSAEVYGNPLVSPQTEDYTGNVDTLGVRNGYEEGKRVAETLFGIYAQKHGVQAKIVRVFNTYGPGMSLSETRVVPAFVRAALGGQPLRIHGEGAQNRCHTFVTDMVRGIRLAMAKGEPGRAYNLGSQKQTTIRELAEAIVRVAGSPSQLQFIDRPSHDHDSRLPDTKRARNELGWEPTIGLDDGLALTLEDFRRRLEARGERLIKAA